MLVDGEGVKPRGREGAQQLMERVRGGCWSSMEKVGGVWPTVIYSRRLVSTRRGQNGGPQLRSGNSILAGAAMGWGRLASQSCMPKAALKPGGRVEHRERGGGYGSNVEGGIETDGQKRFMPTLPHTHGQPRRETWKEIRCLLLRCETRGRFVGANEETGEGGGAGTHPSGTRGTWRPGRGPPRGTQSAQHTHSTAQHVKRATAPLCMWGMRSCGGLACLPRGCISIHSIHSALA